MTSFSAALAAAAISRLVDAIESLIITYILLHTRNSLKYERKTLSLLYITSFFPVGDSAFSRHSASSHFPFINIFGVI